MDDSVVAWAVITCLMILAIGEFTLRGVSEWMSSFLFVRHDLFDSGPAFYGLAERMSHGFVIVDVDPFSIYGGRVNENIGNYQKVFDSISWEKVFCYGVNDSLGDGGLCRAVYKTGLSHPSYGDGGNYHSQRFDCQIWLKNCDECFMTYRWSRFRLGKCSTQWASLRPIIRSM